MPGALTWDPTPPGGAITTARGAQNPTIDPGASVSGAGIRGKKVRSLLGAVAFDLIGITGLPAGASFSGAGSYASAGILAVQSTGTITHNATGWYDGTACLDFVPNADAAEFRIYNAAGLYISDDDGIAFEFGVPDLDT